MNLKSELQNYGVTNVRLFGDSVKPELLDYLDLIESRESSGLLPDGVAESQGRPLLFFVNESHLTQTQAEQEKNYAELRKLRSKLACRGDRAYLARIRPGELKVVPVSLDDQMPEWQIYKPDSSEALTFFSRLANGQYDGKGERKDADYVFSAMFTLVSKVADRLARLELKHADVLSLVGRALFFRFLIDRNIVRERDHLAIAPKSNCLEDCFSNARNSTDTSAWLDDKFNGDLLPLTDDFHEINRLTDGMAFVHLTAIIKGEEPVGDSGWQIPLNFPTEKRNWGAYDFAHVPVGLLSQVYEQFAWTWERENAEDTSVHYTPRNIAATLVDEAFAKLPKAHEARVLDPACGAGVFLVLAFRRLYQAQWEETKKRPDTKAIRAILEKQLVGFDISDSALKLAALSLYLTAIELDPKPAPPVRFIHLQEKVLFNFRRKKVDPETGVVAGSLGEHVGARFDGKFDLVLSNPPWTSYEGDEQPLAAQLNQLSKKIIARRSNELIAAAYENPDSNPDLPFVWKSTEWCKTGGRIAMALPARILLKQGKIPCHARATLLKWLEVTGVINCANLRKTKVWPDVDAPFLLLFANNRKPKETHSLRFITPYPDTNLNGLGEMRIDAKATQPVEIQAAIEQPWLWKALSVGTSLDFDVVSRIKTAKGIPLNEYWVDSHATCQGYLLALSQKQNPAAALKVLPDLHSPKTQALETPTPRFAVDVTRLKKFSRDELHRPRIQEHGDALRIYRAPITLVRASPPTDRSEGRALFSLADVAYNGSYYGYSAPKTPEGELAARYLHLLVHSSLWFYYALLTSGEIGVERPKLQKGDLDRFPIIPVDGLSLETKRQIQKLSTALLDEDTSVFGDVDALFAEIYGLDQRDLEVIADTLEIREPSDELGRRASIPPTANEKRKFKTRLESILRPFFKVTSDEPQVELLKPEPLAPFGLLLISKRGTKISNPDELYHEALLKLANDTGSTRIIQEVEGGLVVALLNQYRYWTPSRARLLGAELVREHLDVFD